MTDKEKHDCDCGEHHDHDCGDDCNCEHENNLITLEMEDGTSKDFVVLDVLEHNGNHYVALAEENSEEYDILRFVEVDDNMELSIIEDDAEYNLVADKFDELFSSSLEDPLETE